MAKKEGLLIKKQVVHRIPKPVREEDILRVTNKGWYIGGRKLAKEEVTALRQEAQDFRGSLLWNLMRRDVHYVAYLQATAKARTDADLVYSGAMYYDLELLEKFLESCSSL